MNNRLHTLISCLNAYSLNGLITGFDPNVSYLTEYSSRDSYLIVSRKQNVFITDGRYTEEAKKYLSCDFAVMQYKNNLFKSIADVCRRLKLERIGFEERNLPYAEYAKIRSYLPAKARLMPVHSFIETIREVKEKKEIRLIKKALEINMKALTHIPSFIRPGRREIEVAAELERFIRLQGARGSSFEIIVACGPNSSYPHHITSQRKIAKDDIVLIDMGVDYLGYKSDLTRVFFLGKITTLARRVYAIVKEAQQRAIERVSPQATAADIDSAVRSFIRTSGFGENFTHNTGHGIGLEVHESPHIASKNQSALKRDMVFTIEPGIYLPGKFGIRIEDVVRVTGTKAEVLSGNLNK